MLPVSLRRSHVLQQFGRLDSVVTLIDRPDGLYDGWECRAESGAAAQKAQGPAVGQKGEDEFGVFWDVAAKDKDDFEFVVHKNGLEVGVTLVDEEHGGFSISKRSMVLSYGASLLL